jgi:acyl dehydratase
MTLAEGETYTHERTFTEADVRQFADVTGDAQDRHTEPGADGRVLVQGLLTGSMLTKTGGDLEVLATRMDFRFRRPVYSGDTVRCAWTNERVTDRPDGVEIEAGVVCRRVGDGEVVLEATVEGIVYDD